MPQPLVNRARQYGQGVIEVETSEIADDLDARGLKCPMPVLLARRRLAALPAGAVLRVVADDPATALDMPVFCHREGHRLSGPQRDGDLFVWMIAKGR